MTLVEPSSSTGPTTILFDELGTRLAVPEVRQTPTLAAYDSLANTFFGIHQPDGTIKFKGTSAAAPVAAGSPRWCCRAHSRGWPARRTYPRVGLRTTDSHGRFGDRPAGHR